MTKTTDGELYIKPSSYIPDRPWALVIRTHDLSGTDYEPISYMSFERARRVGQAGVKWLYGNPDLKKECK